MPNEGVYVNQLISHAEATALLEKYYQTMEGPNMDPFPLGVAYVSAIGHEASAEVFNALFPILQGQVRVNRVPATMRHGDEALCLKLIGRLPEGMIINRESMEEIGYQFYLVRCFDLHTTEVGTYDVAAPHGWTNGNPAAYAELPAAFDLSIGEESPFNLQHPWYFVDNGRARCAKGDATGIIAGPNAQYYGRSVIVNWEKL